MKPRTLLQITKRNFGPKPAGGKGGPGAAASPIPPKRGKTMMEKMIANGNEFIMGPPAGANKSQNAHRDDILHKMEPRMELYARKLREMYHREGTIPTVKSFQNPLRERQPTDTLEFCAKERVLPGVITARDEFPDVDLVWPWRTAFNISRSEHGMVRPWHMLHPTTEEEIRVTCTNIDYHPKTRLPYYMEFQRYVVGRPNLLRLPVVPVQEDKSLHFQAGCNFHYSVKHLWVWSFNDVYPARLEVDCSALSPNMPIKIGDVERMLPYGLYLHKQYDHQKFHSVVRLTPTNSYIARKNLIVDQAEQIKDQRRRMQSSMLEKKKEARQSAAVKAVPTFVQSAKFIMQDKKNLKVKDADGNEITMDELQNRSKDGGAGAKRK